VKVDYDFSEDQIYLKFMPTSEELLVIIVGHLKAFQPRCRGVLSQCFLSKHQCECH